MFVFKKYDRQTMCEVLWRNISDFYVNLRVEVGKHPQVILAMYFLDKKKSFQLMSKNILNGILFYEDGDICQNFWENN